MGAGSGRVAFGLTNDPSYSIPSNKAPESVPVLPAIVPKVAASPNVQALTPCSTTKASASRGTSPIRQYIVAIGYRVLIDSVNS